MNPHLFPHQLDRWMDRMSLVALAAEEIVCVLIFVVP